MIDTTSKSEKTNIDCECGSHHLQIQSEIDYHLDSTTGKTRFHQDFYLAMFYYGSTGNDSFWRRLVIIWKYLRTGKMHSDQIIMDPKEAQRLATFITTNIQESE